MSETSHDLNELVAPPTTLATRLPSTNHLTTLQSIANALVGSSAALPRDCGNGQAIFRKLLTGLELGLPPMASLHEISIIDGKATLNARVMVAIVRNRALGDIMPIVNTIETATVRVTRPNWPTHRDVMFTIEDARRAGLLRKDNWKKYPADMLMARAISRAAKLFFQEVFAGCAYIPDELGVETTSGGEFIDTFIEPTAPWDSPTDPQGRAAKDPPDPVETPITPMTPQDPIAQPSFAEAVAEHKAETPKTTENGLAEVVAEVAPASEEPTNPFVSRETPQADELDEPAGERVSSSAETAGLVSNPARITPPAPDAAASSAPTEDQQDRIRQLIRATRIDAHRWQAILKRTHGVETIKSLNAAQTAEVIDHLGRLSDIKRLIEVLEVDPVKLTTALDKIGAPTIYDLDIIGAKTLLEALQEKEGSPFGPEKKTGTGSIA